MVFKVYMSFIRQWFVLTPNPSYIFRVQCSIYRLFDCFSLYLPTYIRGRICVHFFYGRGFGIFGLFEN